MTESFDVEMTADFSAHDDVNSGDWYNPHPFTAAPQQPASGDVEIAHSQIYGAIDYWNKHKAGGFLEDAIGKDNMKELAEYLAGQGFSLAQPPASGDVEYEWFDNDVPIPYSETAYEPVGFGLKDGEPWAWMNEDEVTIEEVRKRAALIEAALNAYQQPAAVPGLEALREEQAVSAKLSRWLAEKSVALEALRDAAEKAFALLGLGEVARASENAPVEAYRVLEAALPSDAQQPIENDNAT